MDIIYTIQLTEAQYAARSRRAAFWATFPVLSQKASCRMSFSRHLMCPNKKLTNGSAAPNSIW